MKFWNNFSDGGVIRFPQGGGYATSTQVGIDC
jgi:hypothetical protein